MNLVLIRLIHIYIYFWPDVMICHSFFSLTRLYLRSFTIVPAPSFDSIYIYHSKASVHLPIVCLLLIVIGLIRCRTFPLCVERHRHYRSICVNNKIELVSTFPFINIEQTKISECSLLAYYLSSMLLSFIVDWQLNKWEWKPIDVT